MPHIAVAIQGCMKSLTSMKNVGDVETLVGDEKFSCGATDKTKKAVTDDFITYLKSYA